MKKVLSLIVLIMILTSAIMASAVGITWSETVLGTGELTATVTGIEEGFEFHLELPIEE